MKYLTEKEFERSNAVVLFDDKASSRRFGVIAKNQSAFRFSWQSTDIFPEILDVDDFISVIGIDLNFAIINFKDSSILLNIRLNSFYIKTIIKDDILYLISEVEIICIGRITYAILRRFLLPDIFEDIEIADSKIEVKCMGGLIVEFEL